MQNFIRVALFFLLDIHAIMKRKEKHIHAAKRLITIACTHTLSKNMLKRIDYLPGSNADLD